MGTDLISERFSSFLSLGHLLAEPSSSQIGGVVLSILGHLLPVTPTSAGLEDELLEASEAVTCLDPPLSSLLFVMFVPYL